MPSHLVFFRAVNVGGANTLCSSEFVQVLESLNLTEIKTYLQTGNAVFQASTDNAEQRAAKIRFAIHARHAFAPDVIVLALSELERASYANPFPQAADDPKSFQLTSLVSEPKNPDPRSDPLASVGFIYFGDPAGNRWAVQQISNRA